MLLTYCRHVSKWHAVTCWPGTPANSFLCHVADMLANMSATRRPDRHMSVVLTLVSTCRHPTLPAKATNNNTSTRQNNTTFYYCNISYPLKSNSNLSIRGLGQADGTVVFLTQAESYYHWGPAFANYSQLEFECIIQIQDKSSSAKTSNKSWGRKHRPGFQLGSGHPLYASHVGVICMKMCTPMLAGAPPPKFPGNRSIEDESGISKWITVMKYYTEYLINICVPWLDESSPSFERSAEDFCFLVLVHAWSSKSATFIEHQCFCFLSNFMSKGHQSNHKKTVATVWRQRNAN